MARGGPGDDLWIGLSTFFLASLLLLLVVAGRWTALALAGLATLFVAVALFSSRGL